MWLCYSPMVHYVRRCSWSLGVLICSNMAPLEKRLDTPVLLYATSSTCSNSIIFQISKYSNDSMTLLYAYHLLQQVLHCSSAVNHSSQFVNSNFSYRTLTKYRYWLVGDSKPLPLSRHTAADKINLQCGTKLLYPPLYKKHGLIVWNLLHFTLGAGTHTQAHAHAHTHTHTHTHKTGCNSVRHPCTEKYSTAQQSYTLHSNQLSLTAEGNQTS